MKTILPFLTVLWLADTGTASLKEFLRDTVRDTVRAGHRVRDTGTASRGNCTCVAGQ